MNRASTVAIVVVATSNKSMDIQYRCWLQDCQILSEGNICQSEYLINGDNCFYEVHVWLYEEITCQFQ